MKLLLAPAETKRPDRLEDQTPFDPAALLFGPSADRLTAIGAYEHFVSQMDAATQAAFFGLKKPDDLLRYTGRGLWAKPTQKALVRYTGVAFEALDYLSLEFAAKEWCEKNIVIFSNLFGPILGGDNVPDYRFKQGAVLPGLDASAYEASFAPALGAQIAAECVLDLRAEWYIKRYPITTAPVITPVFLKNGKVLSHWAKTQRGRLARFLAQHQPADETALTRLNPPGLQLLEIRRLKGSVQWIFETAEP